MGKLKIEDLPENAELDRIAMLQVVGGDFWGNLRNHVTQVRRFARKTVRRVGQVTSDSRRYARKTIRRIFSKLDNWF